MSVSCLKLVTFKLSERTLAQFEDLKTLLKKETPLFGLPTGAVTRTDVLRYIVRVQHDIYLANQERILTEEQARADAEVHAGVNKRVKKSPAKRLTKKTKGKKS